MASYEIPISSLPSEMTPEDAVETAYREDLDWIVRKLSEGLSVIIECDKQLTVYLYKALRNRIKRMTTPALRCRLISGHQEAAEDGEMSPNSTLMQRILQQLSDAIFSGAGDQIIVLPHLDILTTTTRSTLNVETRETAALLYENPDALFLAFKDPNFEIPPVIENVFTVKVSLVGIAREKLKNLVLQREARKFAVEDFNPFFLYKYLSGLNAIRIRQILSHFGSRVDFDPALPQTRDEMIREIREMTLVSDVELPRVDLEEDIGGYKSVKERIVKDILDLLKARDKSKDADEIAHIEEIIPSGIIFYGPPGTGKTFFAKAIATSLDATITIVSGPELKSKWVGESEQNLRRTFAQARKSAPALIVFDELDSFAAARGSYTGSGVEHSMVNQLLTEMDGFRKEEMVFVIGTTNFMEALDPALLRPGRFELSIEIPYPAEDDRKAILDIYQKKFNLDISQDLLDYLARKTGGYVDERSMTRYSGDHIYAVMRALKREELRSGGKLEITKELIEKSLLRSGGAPVKLEEQEEITVAYHEAGHAILAYVLPGCPTIEKITISTGEDDVLGFVMQEVKKNKYVTTREELLEDICVLMGGRTAEELCLSRVSIGAYNDLQRANEIARMMVEELGMSESLGMRTVGNAQGQHHGAIGAERRQVSDSVARLIDEEIGTLLQAEKDHARELLTTYGAELEKLKEMLLEKKNGWSGRPERNFRR